MKRTLLIAACLLVLLIVAAALILPLLVKVDGYRADIEHLLTQATGREARLGELSLRILPAPVLRASGITLGEDPSFGEEPFLSAESLSVRVALLPLLAGRLEVGLLTIKEPRVRLHRRGNAWNLASLLRAGGGTGPAGQEPSPGGGEAGVDSTHSRPDGGAASPGEAQASGLEIREVLLTGGLIRILDEALPGSAPVRLKASDINMRLTDLTATKPIGIDASLIVAGTGSARILGTIGPLARPPGAGEVPFDADLELEGFDGRAVSPWLEAFTGLRVHSGTLGLEAHLGRSPSGELQIEGDVELGDLEMDPLSGGGPPVKLSASLSMEATIGAAATRLTRGDLRSGDAALSVTGSLDGLGSTPRLQATVRAEEAAVAGVLPVLSILGPFVPAGLGPAGTLSLDVRVSGSPGGSGSWVIEGEGTLAGLELSDPSLGEPVRGISGTAIFDGDSVAITGFEASLGRSRVEGRCTIQGFEQPRIDLTLSSPMLDLDEILAFMAPANRPAAEPAAARLNDSRRDGARRPLQAAGFALAAAPDPASTPAPAAPSALATVSLKGDLSASEAKLMNLKLSGLHAALEMQDGIAHLEGARVSLYGGALDGRISARLVEPGPPFDVEASLAGVDFNAMVADLSPALSGLLFGTMEAGLAVTGTGVDPVSLRSSLEGTATFSLAEGRITSVGFLKQLAEALESAGGRGIGQEETPFSYLGGSFRVRRGKARTEDLRLESPDISMKGEGSLTMDLALDLDLKARLSPEVTAEMVARRESLRFLKDTKERIRLDLKLGGSVAEPKVSVDPEMIRRVIKEATREHLREKAGEGLKELLQKKGG